MRCTVDTRRYQELIIGLVLGLRCVAGEPAVEPAMGRLIAMVSVLVADCGNRQDLTGPPHVTRPRVSGSG